MPKHEQPDLLPPDESIPVQGRWIQACGGECIETTGAVLYIKNTGKKDWQLRCEPASGRDTIIFEGHRSACYDMRREIMKRLNDG
jgi:hypothetical protein